MLKWLLLFLLWTTCAWAQFNGTTGIYALNHMTFAVMGDTLSVLTPGTGYTVNDTITLACPHFVTPLLTNPIVTVTGTSGGSITSVSIADPGYATAIPSTGLAGQPNGVCNFTQAGSSGGGTGAVIYGAFGFKAADTAFINSGVLARFYPWTVPQGGTGHTSFTTGLPILGNGTAALTQGTVLGTSTLFPVVGASHINGNCVQFNSSGLIDSGAPCGSGGSGSGTVSSGAAGQVAYYASAGTTVTGGNTSVLGYTWIGNFGAVCDGSTDDTTAIQNAWNAAAAAKQNLLLSGVGERCKISSISQPMPTQRNAGILAPVASLLVGDGPNTVELTSTVTGSTCAITISNTYETAQTTGVMGGFGLESLTGTGNGICLVNSTKLAIRNIFVYGFSIGLSGIDTIDLHINDSTFSTNSTHIYGTQVSNSYPNAWVIDNNLFIQSIQYSIELVHADQINITGNTFEGSGTNLGLSPATILFDGLAIDGSFGGNIIGNYFENDAVEAIAILPLGGDTRSISYTIIGNQFIRNSSNEGAMIFVGNSATVTDIILAEVRGNNFFDTSPYVPGTNPYISLTHPTVASAQIICSGNSYTSAASMQAPCRVPTASQVFKMDANGVFGGFQ